MDGSSSSLSFKSFTQLLVNLPIHAVTAFIYVVLSAGVDFLIFVLSACLTARFALGLSMKRPLSEAIERSVRIHHFRRLPYHKVAFLLGFPRSQKRQPFHAKIFNKIREETKICGVHYSCERSLIVIIVFCLFWEDYLLLLINSSIHFVTLWHKS